MSVIFRRGLEEAIKKLDSPERVQRHDPVKIFARIDISNSNVVADLGCGTGFFSIPAATIAGHGSGTVYSVDNLPPILKVLQDKLHSASISNVHLVQSDVHALPFESRRVDLVIMANIFYDVRKEEMLSEITRIMSKSGRLLIVEWKKLESAQPGPPVEVRLSQEAAVEYLVDSNYEIMQMFDASSTHYCIVSKPRGH